MRLLRTIAAILIGLAFMAATTAAWTIVGRGTAHPYANLLVTGIGAIIGGWLTARAAPGSPYAHAAALAAIVAVAAVPTATGAPAPSQPGWYPAAIGLVAVLGVLLGGKLRAAAASAEGPTRTFRSGEQRD